MGWLRNIFCKKVEPKFCIGCKHLVSYQTMNNRDEVIEIHHCQVISNSIKNINNKYLNDVSVTINEPINFSCIKHKNKDDV